MSLKHVVVDGSNLATEGRTLPSLQQLDDAVRAFIAEFAPETVTVVVDATFPNRIDDSERATFEAAVEAGEIISPPAGVIGRGDAFVLQIADRADAVVLSNDSFQEFHGQYPWLFDSGRLVGGKPVPYVGWVFMNRSPVRGPLSRRSVSDAKRAAKAAAAAAPPAMSSPQEDGKARRARGKGADKGGKGGKAADKGDKAKPEKKTAAAPAHDVALAGAAKPTVGDSGRRRRGGSAVAVEPYNDALPFIEFVSAHPRGSTVQGEVERFASHGAYVLVDGTRAYLPLKHLADPPPRSAREVLTPGQPYEFVVHAFDTPRRGIDLTMPGVVPEGTAADPVTQPEEARVAPARKKAAAKKAPARKKAAAKKAPARKKSAAKKAPARKRTTAKKAPARKKAAAKKAPARKKAAAKKAPARKKAAAKKAPARKKAAAKKAPARKKKAAAKKAPARKKTAAKRAPARKKAAAKKAPARKKAAARKAPARKKAAARKAPARRR
jgi:hypothetical protein